MSATVKIPGWGLNSVRNSATNLEEKKGLISLEESEANLWAGLKEVYSYKGRIIYRDTNTIQEGT